MDLESVKDYLEKTTCGASPNDIDSMPYRFFGRIIMSGLKVDLIEHGRVVCSMKVPPRLLDEIEIEAKALRVGKAVAVVTVELRNKRTGKIVAQGRHTKYLAVSSKL